MTAQGEGFVELFFLLFPFCNTSCSGECLVLLMLSGSGNSCGSRSLVIRGCCRRHGALSQSCPSNPLGLPRPAGWNSCTQSSGVVWGCGEQPGPQGHPDSTPRPVRPAGFDGWQGRRGAEGRESTCNVPAWDPSHTP